MTNEKESKEKGMKDFIGIDFALAKDRWAMIKIEYDEVSGISFIKNIKEA